MDILQSFNLISVPLPPMLLAMAGVKGDSRFVGLCYRSSKANWTDGRSNATFGFYNVWQPYIDHIAIAIHLFDAHLGADDLEATHVLVCDRLDEKVYVAPVEEALQFLDSQHLSRQPLTPQQWSEIKELIAQQPPLDMSQMQDLGMFELFTPPKPEQREKAMQLVQWLDGYIDKSLIRKYVDAADSRDYRAVIALESFRSRCL